MNGIEFIVLISKIIILSLTLTIRSQSSGESQPKKGPGVSSCIYHGLCGMGCSKTHKKPIDFISKECTSIIWDGLTVDYYNNDGLKEEIMDQDKPVLDQLLKYGKSVYVFYGQSDQRVWANVFDCDGSNKVINIEKNMETLKTYMKLHPGIKGLILKELHLNKYSSECKGYTDHLVTYIKVMREMFPDLEIGMKLDGNSLLDYYANPKMEWLDLKVLDKFLDFYVIDVTELNECESEFRVGGTSPVTGNAPYTYTKVQECLNKINVPGKKTYYEIDLTVSTKDIDTLTCKKSYQKICTMPIGTSSYCADTTQSFFEKGQFIKKTAAGFVGENIDLADPENACGCSRRFESFYDVLDGFNGNPAPKSCKLMDDRFSGSSKFLIWLGFFTHCWYCS